MNCFSLDREAFSFTNYDLKLRIEPEQHRVGVRGKITLRNDTATPQKIAALQISSSLDWRAIRVSDKPVQFLTQTYTSDIDHTGALSEAIVTLPQPVAPKQTVDLEIAYEGVILLDATRLTRIGTPEDVAKSTDWDRIDEAFTAVRGVGYVAWYPIATESASLSEGESLTDVLGRWKRKEAESKMHVIFESTKSYAMLFSGNPEGGVISPDEGIATIGAFDILRFGTSVPTFLLADYKKMEVKGGSTLNFLPGKEATATSYAEMLGDLDPLPEVHGPRGIQIADLPDAANVPFVTENLLLTPLRLPTAEDRLTLVYALARRKAHSPRAWINEGLAHFTQVLDIEQQQGRQAALNYLKAHAGPLVDFERQSSTVSSISDTESARAVDQSLLNMTDEVWLESKAMYVWWMLRDMVGDAGINRVLFSYEAPKDTTATYLPKLFEKHTQRDLEWFFDDWVYRDRGLPDFKVESAYSRKTMKDSFMLTITLDDLGNAGAEVPIIVKYNGGEIMKRLEVHAKNKAVVRVEVPAAPQEIVVNDGSVPESNLSNNVFKVAAPDD